MDTITTSNRSMDILHWIRKRSARSVLLLSFLSLMVGVVTLVIGSTVISKIIFFVVLFLMFCSLTLGLINMLLARRRNKETAAGHER